MFLTASFRHTHDCNGESSATVVFNIKLHFKYKAFVSDSHGIFKHMLLLIARQWLIIWVIQATLCNNNNNVMGFHLMLNQKLKPLMELLFGFSVQLS